MIHFIIAFLKPASTHLASTTYRYLTAWEATVAQCRQYFHKGSIEMTLAELYNFCGLSANAKKNFGPLFTFNRKDPMPVSPSSFCAAELQKALKEQAFGIKTFTMGSSSAEQATASVVLLEGHRLALQLTTQGYSVSSGIMICNLPSHTCVLDSRWWLQSLRDSGRPVAVREHPIFPQTTRNPSGSIVKAVLTIIDTRT